MLKHEDGNQHHDRRILVTSRPLPAFVMHGRIGLPRTAGPHRRNGRAACGWFRTGQDPTTLIVRRDELP